MRNLLSQPLIAIVLSLALVFSACQSGQKKDDKGENKSVRTQKIDKEEIEQDVREFVYPLPTSFEVTEMLNRIGASYILTLSNSAENVDKYLTETKQALNLGVYGADLSYASTYNQKQQIVTYMEASKKLIDVLNITGALPTDILDKIEQNEDNKDELVEIITNTFYDTYEFLNVNQRGSVSMLVLAGSWVEALYITTNISEDTYQNKEMVKIVMEQKSSLNKLLEIMKKYESDPAVAAVIEQLTPLAEIYNMVEDNAISEKQMNMIIQEVTMVRNDFVE
ncbi:hypothetical protein BY457_10138 [Marinilabilia salmonicolor]|jgi:hypothetical protein|uniref:hypothetical protein n=1 Tax=Marinilabilia salmonicolor TaxID=989 RepID=UPI000D0780F1|nr:hypothetical protein [Marinilabilia salmonicolor]PRZ02018.1 hypothetical protein BY457_10138 [Marinilabilia salmonicolor]